MPLQKTRYKSYSQAVKADRQVSLIHEHIKKPHIDEPSQNKTLNSRIYKTSRSKGAYLFDISVCRDHYSDLQSMMLLKEQHPNVYACVPLNDGPRRYLEVYITKKDDSSNIFENGLYFKESNLVVYPCTALPDSAKILKIKLLNLPMLPKDEVLAGLKQSLTLFGNIIDVGIAAEPNTGLFMGTGYAVLNVEQAANKENKFIELSHQLSWCESESEVIHAIGSICQPGVDTATKKGIPSSNVLSLKPVLFVIPVTNRATALSSALADVMFQPTCITRPPSRKHNKKTLLSILLQ
jgi:hypothetical protein